MTILTFLVHVNLNSVCIHLLFNSAIIKTFKITQVNVEARPAHASYPPWLQPCYILRKVGIFDEFSLKLSENLKNFKKKLRFKESFNEIF